MALNDVRAMPETRIPAAVGIPAILLQLYTGIQKSTYNNLAKAIQQGWRGGIIPMMRVFESQINLKLMPLYGNGKRDVFAWDTSVVPELQDDTLALREADRADVAAGILTADEARERQGLGPKPIEATPAPTALPAVPAAKSLTAFRKVAGQTPGNIYDVADAFRRALARDEAATIDALATEWARAQRNLDKRIKELLDYISKHQETAGWRDEALKRLLTLQDQISDELSGLADRGAAIVEDGQRATILSTTQYAEPLARAAAGAVPAGKTFPWATLSSDAFEALVGLSSDGSPLSTLLDSFAGDTGLLIRNALLDGIVKGENPRTVAQRLSVTTSVSRARLESIARTEMLRASREATRRTYAANGDVLSGYRRLSAADSRTCVSCWALHGTLSTTAEIMPSHPQCRCVMLPNLRSWAEITGDMSIPDERETMASGAELFSMLPESDQAEILGPSRFELYRAGASLESFSATENDPQWGPTTRVKPLAEVTQ
jgi:SPP1 gp7 family putative phage head morphogenesis protein